MSTEQINLEYFREDEVSLKKKLEDFKETMTVRLEWWKKYRVTLLQVYSEWMNYLEKKKNKEKNKSVHLIDQWRDFVVTHGVDISVKLLIEFFKKKRDYKMLQEKWVTWWDYWTWEDICINLWLYQDKNLIDKFFPSYSAAEVRIRRRIEREAFSGKLSDNLVETLTKGNDKLKGFEQSKIWELQKGKNLNWFQLEMDFSDETVTDKGKEENLGKVKKEKILEDKSKNSEETKEKVSNYMWKDGINLDELYAYDPDEPYWNR